MRFIKTTQHNIFTYRHKAGGSQKNGETPGLSRWLIMFLLGLIFLLPNSAQAKSTNLQPGFPRVANYFLGDPISKTQAKDLAQWDIVIVSLENQYVSPDIFEIMREENPNIIILAYIPSEEVEVENTDIKDQNHPLSVLYKDLKTDDTLYLRDIYGNHLSFFPGSRLLNVNSDWKYTLPHFITDQVLQKNPQKWDGVFYDNCFNDISWVSQNIDMNRDGQPDNPKDADQQWKNSMETIMKETRRLNKGKLIVCNSGGEYYTYINGRLMEAFPSKYDGKWDGSMKKYFKILKQAKNPSIVVINSVANTGDSRQYRKMRFNLASTLMGDGFASFSESVSRHYSLWWYDEYNVGLGNALGGAYNVETHAGMDNITPGVWRRNFQRGIVMVNSTNKPKKVLLEDGFEKILGTQDTTINNGKIIGSVTIPAHDGIILQGRITQVTNAPFMNGSYARVTNAEGKRVRNSFFTYNSLYNGGDTVVYADEINTTVVADTTYVTVYKNGKRKARFAPYGSAFRGGITIDVDRLDGPNKGYKIVTGTKQGGAQVRIFNINGTVRNQGCYAFDKSFNGGVNVAIGDLIKDNRGKEIVVAPAQGGGPQIRILDRNCRIINNGFFAYDKNLHSGVSVAVGDVTNDGKDEIITIPGRGGAPFVRMFNARGKALTPGFYAFSKKDRSGAQVVISDVDGNGKNELVTMSFSIFNQ